MLIRHSYSAFTASNVLLFGAARSLRDHVVGDVDNQLSEANSCLTALRQCATEEPISARFLSIMKPTYDALRKLQQRAYEDSRHRSIQPDSKIRINDLLESTGSSSPTSSPSGNAAARQAISEEASTIVIHTAMLLKDPFGRTQPVHQTFGIGGYPTPPPTDTPLFWFR
jgi:hypothetical protein